MNSTFVMTVFDFLDDENQAKTVERRLYALLLCARKRLDMRKQGDGNYRILAQWSRWFYRTQMDDEKENVRSEKRGNDILHVIDLLALPPLQAQYLKHYLTEKTWNYTEMEKEILIIAGESFLLNEKEVCSFLESLMEN